MSSIKTAQLNIHKAKAAPALAVKNFSKHQFGLMPLQEPWINNGQVCGLSVRNGDLVYDARHECPRACIIIKRTITYSILSEFVSKDLVAVEITHPTSQTHQAS